MKITAIKINKTLLTFEGVMKQLRLTIVAQTPIILPLNNHINIITSSSSIRVSPSRNYYPQTILFYHLLHPINQPSSLPYLSRHLIDWKSSTLAVLQLTKANQQSLPVLHLSFLLTRRGIKNHYRHSATTFCFSCRTSHLRTVCSLPLPRHSARRT